MEEKDYKDMTPEEKEKFLKKAKAAGIATGITGASTAALGFLTDSPAGKNFREYAKKQGYNVSGKHSRTAKIVGTGIATAGTGLYGVAKYKHYKLKKKDENSKKD